VHSPALARLLAADAAAGPPPTGSRTES
jgi:hypothetical protein